MRNIKRYHIAFLLAISLTLGVICSGQTPTPTPKPKVDDDVIRVESRLVVVPVSVSDVSGQPVMGLKAQDFRVTEENRPQTIDNIGNAEVVPLEIALLFDISASTDAMFKYEQETAAKFLREVMKPNDRASIFTIGEKGRLIQSRDTADRSMETIMSIKPTTEYTAFYDAVRMAADHLKKNAPEGTRKVMLIISDGDDTWSESVQRAIRQAESKVTTSVQGSDLYRILVKATESAKLAEQGNVVRSIQDADTVFYSINPGGNSYKLSDRAVFAQQGMERFASDTGGTAFLPKLLPVDTKDPYEGQNNLRKNQAMLDLIFRQITSDLRSQYLIQYYSDADYPLGRYVKLDVALQNRSGLRLRARQGYYVKK